MAGLDSLRGALADPTLPRRPKRSAGRTRDPQETYDTVRPLMRAAGITRVADVTGLDRIGIPVTVVARPNARALSVSQGKGPDLLSAKVSGIMEALESFHAERPDLPVRLLSWSELAGSGRAVDPERLPMRLSVPFDPDRRMAWTPALDLVSGQERLAPLDLVHTDLSRPGMPGAGPHPVSSNGLASGNTYAEALLQGLCEVIERDAFALFEAGALRSGGPIDLTHAAEPLIEAARHRVARARVSLEVLELTTEIGVPVFFATLTGGSDSPVTAAPAGGLGCHPDRNWACLRAIYEAAQSRLTRLSGGRDDLRAGDFRTPARHRTRESGPSRPLDDGAGFGGETVEADLQWTVRRLAAAGLTEILAVDLARPDFGLPVVRVIVPGLEHPPSADVIAGPRTRPAA